MERALKEKQLAIKLIPVPRVISSSCGLAARTLVDDLENVKTVLTEKEIEIDESFIMTENNNIRPL